MATCDTPTLIAAACENKFTCLDQRSRRFVKLQLLCEISDSQVIPPVIPPAPNSDVSSGKVGGNLNNPELGFRTDDPPEDNWEGFWSPTGIGDPTTDPGEWLPQTVSLVDLTNWAVEMVEGRSPGEWGALRYRSGGVWSPWRIMNNFP